jgi:hypothetical protein
MSDSQHVGNAALPILMRITQSGQDLWGKPYVSSAVSLGRGIFDPQRTSLMAAMG